jgi:hypothetical protein
VREKDRGDNRTEGGKDKEEHKHHKIEKYLTKKLNRSPTLLSLVYY